MIIVYISGAITGIPNYREKFDLAEKELTEKGYTVINPARVLDELPKDLAWDDYMELCYPMVKMSGFIYQLDNWEKSKGACIEYGYAKGLGIGLLKEN
jgi:hypothetical protein